MSVMARTPPRPGCARAMWNFTDESFSMRSDPSSASLGSSASSPSVPSARSAATTSSRSPAVDQRTMSIAIVVRAAMPITSLKLMPTAPSRSGGSLDCAAGAGAVATTPASTAAPSVRAAGVMRSSNSG